MSKEKALSKLSTAMSMASPEDIKTFVQGAIIQLRTEEVPEEALSGAAIMIAENLEIMKKNLLDYADTPVERAMKLSVCESCLFTIKEYASAGLKGRVQGSLNVAEEIHKAQMNRSLTEFSEVQEMRQVLKEHGATMKVELHEDK
jgi:hypothetical protein